MRQNLSPPQGSLIGAPSAGRFGSSPLLDSRFLAAALAFGMLMIAVAALSTPTGSAPASSEDPALPAARSGPSTATQSVHEKTKQGVRMPTGSSRSPSSRTGARPTRACATTPRAQGHAFYFTPDKAVLSFTKKDKGVALHLTPLGASPDATLEATRPRPRQGQLPGRLRAPHEPPDLPRTRLPRPLAGNRHGLPRPGREPQVRVPPAARRRPEQDRARLPGSGGPLDRDQPGALLIQHAARHASRLPPAELPARGRQARPGRQPLRAEGEQNAYGFALGASYDPSRPLVIDPGLAYSTYLGGGVDRLRPRDRRRRSGNAYVTGETTPPTSRPRRAPSTRARRAAFRDAFVTKLNAAGSALVYSTFLGGTEPDSGRAIAVDARKRLRHRAHSVL